MSPAERRGAAVSGEGALASLQPTMATVGSVVAAYAMMRCGGTLCKSKTPSEKGRGLYKLLVYVTKDFETK